MLKVTPRLNIQFPLKNRIVRQEKNYEKPSLWKVFFIGQIRLLQICLF